MISPNKQRMKFTVLPHHQMKQDGSSKFHIKDHCRSSRPIPSKWNDAEKWILNKQNQNRLVGPAPQHERLKPSMKQPKKRADFTKPRKFESLIEAGVPAMRDMGTEMTPIPSQEPSRSPTPVAATTPLRSPASSLPSSPQKEAVGEKELSEQEMKSKIAREIVALGVQLGKMNIVAWASKDERQRNIDDLDKAVDARSIEYRKRGDAWEEAEKSKHEARFKREEIRIQEWESRQKAKSIAKMRRMEANIEQMRARIQAKMASEKRKTEEKRATKNHQHPAQADYIRRTGPTYFTICWSKKQFYD